MGKNKSWENMLSVFGEDEYIMEKTISSLKKTKKKLKKKRKPKMDRLVLCPGPQVVYEPSEYEVALQKSQTFHAPIYFNILCHSAFFFGNSVNGYIGKRDSLDGHIAVIGGSGSGKSYYIARPTIQTWKSPKFVVDLKGDLIPDASVNAKIIYMLNGSKNRYYYDPFECMRKNGITNPVQEARDMAQAIIPLPHNYNGNPFWIMSARDILTGSLVYFFNQGETFIDALIMVGCTKIAELLKLIKTDEIAARCLRPDLNLKKNPEMLLGIVADLFTHISVFTSDPLIYEVFSPSADTDEDPKELLRWEDLEDHDIFLRIEQGRLQQWGCVVRLMLVQLIRTLERRPEKYSPEGANTKPVLLLLDEFPQFGKLDIITSALATLRSKNVTVAIFCQSFADLDAIYGKDTRRIILDNCQYKLILGAGDPETQRFLSDMVGTTMLPMPSSSENYDEFGESSGHSISKCLSRERIIQPHEFASLKDAILLHPDGFCRVKKEAYRSTEPEAIDVSYVEL